MDNKNIFKYHKPYPDEGLSPSTETRKVIDWVGNGKQVLEFGCHTGHLASWLIKNECQITGVEINQEALLKAKPFLAHSINADLDDQLVWEHLNSYKFDVITFLHILEHLKDPQLVLNRSVDFLNKDGIIIIGLPNISNANDRFYMLKGRFKYTDIGVMDRTHLRFFNQKTARELIESAGLKIIDYYSPWQVNPVKVFFDHIPFLWRLSRFFNPNKPQRFPRFSRNLTDVVMLFKCRKE